jgi:hypothetical protein
MPKCRRGDFDELVQREVQILFIGGEVSVRRVQVSVLRSTGLT